jgi:hypothetical protein
MTQIIFGYGLMEPMLEKTKHFYLNLRRLKIMKNQSLKINSELSNLDFLEPLTDDESANLSGGNSALIEVSNIRALNNVNVGVNAAVLSRDISQDNRFPLRQVV